MTSSASGVTAVLVHGAWADGSSWSKVIVPLRNAGLDVVCAPIPLTSLTDDSNVVASIVERTHSPVVLVGHAYAGAVIGSVKSDNVKALVFIAALAPDAGETVADVFYRDDRHADAPELTPDARGFIWMPDVGFDKAFAQNATAAEKVVSAAVQRPISVECIKQAVTEPAWKSTKSWYLLAEEDRMINPQTQRWMAERMKASVRAHNVDHTPSLTAPETVIDIIVEAAKAVSAA
ncbi:alpha/beta hydrolase [Paraburkholderia rhizosphaerae]|uniref:Pimeloyl-ACP methyl ester carboxylesterase n=1 Tax=Paraburkholderia rhizosphaerae TaxID=480658 RepID=A0A4R8LUI3_9BURK|nr:alpha/beta hydrolase [Paraburkholderia rhizosphaerae]TDY51440.1 pimeloyl-ACP methyl ester carboxylesterase [Paraburkholderia rhizosphaerae]